MSRLLCSSEARCGAITSNGFPLTLFFAEDADLCLIEVKTRLIYPMESLHFRG